MTGPAAIVWSVVILAAGAPVKKPAPTPKPVVTATVAATPTPTPTPPPTPTPVPTPSLSESIDFIKEKLATYGTHDFEVGSAENENESGRATGVTTVRAFDSDGCILTMGRKLDIQTSTVGDPDGDYRDLSDLEWRIPLKEVNVTVTKSPVVKVAGFEVRRGGGLTQLEIKAKGDRKPIGVNGAKTIEDGDQKKEVKVAESVATAPIIFVDDDIAVRAKKALENAIGLCQRKKEAF